MQPAEPQKNATENNYLPLAEVQEKKKAADCDKDELKVWIVYYFQEAYLRSYFTK